MVKSVILVFNAEYREIKLLPSRLPERTRRRIKTKVKKTNNN